MSWFRKKNQRIESVPAEERRVKTEGVFEKCPGCDAALYTRELEDSAYVCQHCGHHFRIGARQRLALLYDEGKYEELDAEVISTDPLEFVDTKPYRERLEQARRKTGLPEAVINARGRLGGHPTLIAAMDFQFLGGSMGCAVGEKITRLGERAVEERSAVVLVSQSARASSSRPSARSSPGTSRPPSSCLSTACSTPSSTAGRCATGSSARSTSH